MKYFIYKDFAQQLIFLAVMRPKNKEEAALSKEVIEKMSREEKFEHQFPFYRVYFGDFQEKVKTA